MRSTKIMIACLLSAGMAVGLAGCGGSPEGEPTPSTSPEASASATPSSTPSVNIPVLTSLDEVTVSTDTKSTPEVDASWPLKVEESMTKVVVPGKGPEVGESSPVTVNYHGINATTGKVFDSSWKTEKPVTFDLGQVVPGFKKAIQGQQVGSRIVTAIAPVDGYGPAGGQPQAGIGAEDTLIFVIDIVDAQLEAPFGELQSTVEGMPKVDAKAAVPAITIGDLPAPKETKAVDLIKGKGTALDAAGQLHSHALCVTWDGKEFYNDYTTGVAIDGPGGRTHEALWGALVGHTQGSRVLVTMPGDKAFPNASKNPEVEANTPAACVVDLLMVTNP